MVSWSSAILNSFIAPEISSFTDAMIPDFEGRFPESQHWVSNNFLNSIFRLGYADGIRQAVVGILRRVSHAHEYYSLARMETLAYLDGNHPLNPRVKKYYHAVATWEILVLDLSMVMDLYKWVFDGKGAFLKNDGSKEFRIYTIGNHIKHIPSCIDSGQCTTSDTLPLWLSNSGLESFGISVSFREVFEVLCDACKLADMLQDRLNLIEFEKQLKDSDENA